MDKHQSQPARRGTKAHSARVTSLSSRRSRELPKSPAATWQEMETAQLLTRLRELVDQLPDLNASRVVALHEQIARGEYRVDSASVARKLRRLETELERRSEAVKPD